MNRDGRGASVVLPIVGPTGLGDSFDAHERACSLALAATNPWKDKQMPLFIDVHSLDDPVILTDVARARDADLRTQGPHNVSYLRYWVEEADNIFCLVDAPSPGAAADVHREAHGPVTKEIYQVTEGRN